MPPFDLEDLRGRGFAGFLPVAELAAAGCATVPIGSGAYVVLRGEDGAPTFLERGRGGWWKGRDPTLPVGRLEREWVHGAQTVYIGKAASLRERVGLLVTFAGGEPAMHWGGRLLWQLERCETLLVAWRLDDAFAALETELMDDFVGAYRRLPFANLKRERVRR